MNEVNKMSTWFECKVKYDKMMENGMQKKVTEPYMVDALSFTEAEARIIKEMTPFISGDFSVAKIKRANISELFFDETGDIAFRRMVGYAAHGGPFLQPAVPPGEGQLQLPGGQDRIVEEHLIEVPQPEKQDVILMLVFDSKVLLHHWGQLCHIQIHFGNLHA